MSNSSDSNDQTRLLSAIQRMANTSTELDSARSLALWVAEAAGRAFRCDNAIVYLDETPFEKSAVASSADSFHLQADPRLLTGYGEAHKGEVECCRVEWSGIGPEMEGEAEALLAGLPLDSPLSGTVALGRSGEPFSPDEVQLMQLFINSAGPLVGITDLKKRIELLTTRDPLTLLYHSEAFYDRLRKVIDISHKKKVPVSLMLIDIDNFRSYNDRFGHNEGNYLLQEIAGCMREICSKAGEIPCRYSGEEFALLLEGEGREKAYQMAGRIAAAVKSLFEADRAKATVTVSIGIATIPSNARNESELILAVDNALYYSKTIGADNIYHFDDLPAQSTEFKPMIEALSHTLIRQASEEADEEGGTVVEKLRDELERAVNRTREDSPTTEMIGREAVFSLAATVDARDIYTRGHSEQVATYAHQIAEAMNLPLDEQEMIYIAGFLHDIGKIIIPDYILNKSEQLLPNEWTPIREHPAAGVRILEPFEGLKKLLPIVLHHHERWNGTGYPLGLKGDKIPRGARIICVADSFDAMTSDRCYRSEKSVDIAIKELRDNAGVQFDPEVVEAFLSLGFAELMG